MEFLGKGNESFQVFGQTLAAKGFAMNVTARETAQCLAKFIEVAYEGIPAAVVEARTRTNRASDF